MRSSSSDGDGAAIHPVLVASAICIRAVVAHFQLGACHAAVGAPSDRRGFITMKVCAKSCSMCAAWWTAVRRLVDILPQQLVELVLVGQQHVVAGSLGRFSNGREGARGRERAVNFIA